MWHQDLNDVDWIAALSMSGTPAAHFAETR
jgi:hypothetical protein